MPVSSPHEYPDTFDGMPLETIGREEDLRRIHALLDTPHTRLVTLAGPPGVGKTHLAQVILRARWSSPASAAIFVSLSSHPQGEDLLPAIASQLGIQSSSLVTTSEDYLRQLGRVLGGQPVLIVLDAFEYLPAEAAAGVSDLLRHVPGVVVLATSRRPLGITEETIVTVDPLPLPATRLAAVAGAASLGANVAVQLFVARAAEAQPGFVLSRANASVVMDIVTRVAGIPLAIELAAAQLAAISLDDLAATLATGPDESLGNLLEGVVLWSYRRLTGDGQRMFRSLALFEGSFDRQRVAGLLDISPADVTRILSTLAATGLITTTTYGGVGPQFRLLDLPREIAFRLLRDAGEEPDLRDRLAAWFLEIATEADHAAFHADQDAWFGQLEAAVADLHATLAWLDETGRHQEFVDLVVASKFFWLIRVHYAEGLTYLHHALDLVSLDEAGTIGRLWLGVGFINFYQGLLGEAKEAFDRAALLLETQANMRDRGLCALGASITLFHLGEIAVALPLHVQATEYAHAHSPAFGQGMAALQRADFAYVAVMSAPAADAIPHIAAIDATIDWLRAVRLTWVESMVLTVRMQIALHHLDDGKAIELLAQLLTRTYEHHLDKRTAAEALATAALVAVRRDQPERAAQLLGAHDLLVDQVGGTILYISRLIAPMEITRTQVQAALGQSRFDYLLANGRGLSPDHFIRLTESVLPEWPQVVAGLAVTGESPTSAPDLSVRELDVLELLMLGWTNDEIALQLGVGRSAVAKRIERILQATGAPTRHAAAHYARVRGMIEGLVRTLPADPV